MLKSFIKLKVKILIRGSYSNVFILNMNNLDMIGKYYNTEHFNIIMKVVIN